MSFFSQWLNSSPSSSESESTETPPQETARPERLFVLGRDATDAPAPPPDPTLDILKLPEVWLRLHSNHQHLFWVPSAGLQDGHLLCEEARLHIQTHGQCVKAHSVAPASAYWQQRTEKAVSSLIAELGFSMLNPRQFQFTARLASPAQCGLWLHLKLDASPA
jgi:hypothetical protein